MASPYPNYVAQYIERLEEFEYPERWSIATGKYPKYGTFAQAARPHKIDKLYLGAALGSGFLQKFGRMLRKLGGVYTRKGRYDSNYLGYREVILPWTRDVVQYVDIVCESSWAKGQDGDTEYNLRRIEFSGSAKQSGSDILLSTHKGSHWVPGKTVAGILQEVVDDLGGWATEAEAQAEIDRKAAENEDKKRLRKERDQRDDEINEAVGKLGETLEKMGFNVQFYSNSKGINFKDKETVDRLEALLRKATTPFPD